MSPIVKTTLATGGTLLAILVVIALFFAYPMGFITVAAFGFVGALVVAGTVAVWCEFYDMFKERSPSKKHAD